LAPLTASVLHYAARAPSHWRCYLELTKPKVVALISFTALVGALLAGPGVPPLEPLLCGILGIALAAGCAATLNHVLDRRIDGQMTRTRGGDRAAYHIWQTAPNGGWGNWSTLAGHDLRELALGRNADGRLELFALGGDHYVYHIWQIAPNGGWGNWSFLR
jgi:hypothetical protein